MRKTQQGIALVETLLIVLIIVIIGFGGYYVWHTQKSTDKTNADTLRASQSTPVNTSSKFLVIKEWGVRIPYSGADSYTYNYDSNTPDSIEIQSSELASKYNCSEIGAGLLGRFLPTDTVGLEGTGSPTAEQYAKANPGTFFKVGKYYYSWTHDQAPCSETVTPTAQNEASSAFQMAVKNIEAIPQ